MYKGSTTYDSFDDSDTEVVQELNGDEDDEELLRISKEFQDPEDSPNKGNGHQERIIKKGKTVVVAYKPSKSKMSEIFSQVKSALKSKDLEKINDIIEDLTEKDDKEKRESQSNDYEEDAYSGRI